MAELRDAVKIWLKDYIELEKPRYNHPKFIGRLTVSIIPDPDAYNGDVHFMKKNVSVNVNHRIPMVFFYDWDLKDNDIEESEDNESIPIGRFYNHRQRFMNELEERLKDDCKVCSIKYDHQVCENTFEFKLYTQ